MLERQEMQYFKFSQVSSVFDFLEIPILRVSVSQPYKKRDVQRERLQKMRKVMQCVTLLGHFIAGLLIVHYTLFIAYCLS